MGKICLLFQEVEFLRYCSGKRDQEYRNEDIGREQDISTKPGVSWDSAPTTEGLSTGLLILLLLCTGWRIWSLSLIGLLNVCSSPTLSYPQSSGTFIFDTDASNIGIGAVLSQVQDKEEKVIQYFSNVLSKPEKNYCVTRKELLAIVRTVEHFHKYLYGREFLIRTDHAALTWLLQMKNPEG